MASVSYTHLDVYKRQEESLPIRPEKVISKYAVLAHTWADPVCAHYSINLDSIIPFHAQYFHFSVSFSLH